MTDARKLLVAMTLAAALASPASPARGEEGDAESRFHAAYETEVVDGKLADAARVYLALLADEKAPPRIRAEAKYRFAVTTVLLGRSDEARAHLDELVRDAATPEPVRARAKASLEAVSGVGLGTELDRKLQSLVFDLGRAGGDPDPPPVYRDFEILGKQAVPMLRQLLAHQDASLRNHAYRLLMRLDEPGMGKHWTYTFGSTAGTHSPRSRDLDHYLARRPDERAALEEAVLTLDAEKFGFVASIGSWTPSAGFLRAATARGVEVKRLIVLAGRAWKDPEVEKLLWEWVCDPDPAVVRAVAPLVLTSTALKVQPGDPEAPKYLAGVVNAYSRVRADFPDPMGRGSKSTEESAGLFALANACTVPELLAHLERLVAAAASSPQTSGPNEPAEAPWWGVKSGLAGVLAASVESRAPAGDELSRYAAIVVDWAEFEAARRWPTSDVTELGRRLQFVLTALPRKAAEDAARRIFGGPNPKALAAWTGVLPNRTAEHVAVALAAYRAADPEVGPYILSRIGLVHGSEPNREPDLARAALAALPEIVGIHVRSGSARVLPVATFVQQATLVPPDAAQTALVGTVRAISAHPDGKLRGESLSQLLQDNGNREILGVAWDAVVLPVAEPVFESLDADGRNRFLQVCTWLLARPSKQPDRATLADFVATHIEDLVSAGELSKSLDVLPPERWVARANPQVVTQALGKGTPAETAAADAALPSIAPTAAAGTASVRAFVRVRCSPEVQRAFFDRFLREAPVAMVASLIEDQIRLDELPCDPAALEAAAIRLAETTEGLPKWALLRFVSAAVAKHPSERLFPAVRKLLASQVRSDVLAGIAAAESLGRAELLDSLADKLDSMDAGVREAARKAIDAIVELRALRDEARKRATETKSK